MRLIKLKLPLTPWYGVPAKHEKYCELTFHAHYQPEVEDTADAYINIAKNSSMTGQAVQIGKRLSEFHVCRISNFTDSGFVVNY